MRAKHAWDSAIVRPGTLPRWTPPPVSILQSWVEDLNGSQNPLLVIASPHEDFRRETFKAFYQVKDLVILGASKNNQDWLAKGIVDDLTQRVRGFTGRPWGLVWDLLDVQDVIVEEPLTSLLKQGLRFTSFFRALREGKAMLQKGRRDDALALLGSVFRWLSAQELGPEHRSWLERMQIRHELQTLHERLDMLLFLLALAYQNDLADRTVFVLDGLDKTLRLSVDKRKHFHNQMLDTIQTFDRWARLGSSAGVVIGLDASDDTLDILSQYNDRLGKRVRAALV